MKMFTDAGTDGWTDTKLIAICPEPFGQGIKIRTLTTVIVLKMEKFCFNASEK